MVLGLCRHGTSEGSGDHGLLVDQMLSVYRIRPSLDFGVYCSTVLKHSNHLPAFKPYDGASWQQRQSAS